MAISYSARLSGEPGSRGKMMVTAIFNGRSVTRHTINGIGKHPDDGMPKRHAAATLRHNIEQRELVKLVDEIEVIKRVLAVADLPDDIRQERTARLELLRMRIEPQRLVLRDAGDALNKLQHEDPLLVRYIL